MTHGHSCQEYLLSSSKVGFDFRRIKPCGRVSQLPGLGACRWGFPPPPPTVPVGLRLPRVRLQPWLGLPTAQQGAGAQLPRCALGPWPGSDLFTGAGLGQRPAVSLSRGPQCGSCQRTRLWDTGWHCAWPVVAAGWMGSIASRPCVLSLGEAGEPRAWHTGTHSVTPGSPAPGAATSSRGLPALRSGLTQVTCVSAQHGPGPRSALPYSSCAPSCAGICRF